MFLNDIKRAMETLIRNKYERKLYIKKDGEPPARKDAQITKVLLPGDYYI